MHVTNNTFRSGLNYPIGPSRWPLYKYLSSSAHFWAESVKNWKTQQVDCLPTSNFRKTIWSIHYIWTLQWHHFEVNNALLLYPISEIPIPSFMMCGIWSVDCGDVTIIVKHWNLAILISSPISLHLSCNFHSTIKIPI